MNVPAESPEDMFLIFIFFLSGVFYIAKCIIIAVSIHDVNFLKYRPALTATLNWSYLFTVVLVWRGAF